VRSPEGRPRPRGGQPDRARRTDLLRLVTHHRRAITVAIVLTLGAVTLVNHPGKAPKARPVVGASVVAAHLKADTLPAKGSPVFPWLFGLVLVSLAMSLLVTRDHRPAPRFGFVSHSSWPIWKHWSRRVARYGSLNRRKSLSDRASSQSSALRSYWI